MKKYFCDWCNTETWVLYSVYLDDGEHIDLCRACYFVYPMSKSETQYKS